MKRLILFILLLAAPAVGASAVVFPGTSTITLEDPWTQLARMSGPMLGSGGGVAACSTPTGDELSEGFGATPNVTWTAVTLTPEYGHTLQAGAPDGSCSTGLRLITSESEGRERIYWDRGSTIAADVTIDIKFSFYLNVSGVDAGVTRAITGFAPTNEGDENSLVLKNASGTAQLYARGSSASTSVTISAGTWYEITLHLDATAADSYFKLTGGGSTTCDADSECKFTRSAGGSRYFVIGRNSYFDDLLDFEIGYLTINTP